MPITHSEILTDVDPNDLIPYEDNAAIHDQPAINRSLSELGDAQIPSVDENMMILGGHGRRNYYLDAEKRIPYVQKCYGLSEAEKIALRLALNNIKSGTDLVKAKKAVNTLARLGYDLKYTGFNQAELASMIEETTAKVSEAAAALTEKYSQTFQPIPIRPGAIDPYAKRDWTPDYPIDAPKIDVSGGVRIDRESAPLPEESLDDDKGLAYVLMLTFKSLADGDKFLESLGRAERFAPGKRSLHVDLEVKNA